MSKANRIATLNAVAEERKQDCLNRTEKAISKLLLNHQIISFGSVAREADVSISYLYKYPEIKERIQDIRNQQKKGIKKSSSPQIASEKSKQAIIDQLRSRIKTLEWERLEQAKEIQALTGRLYEIGRAMDLVDRLKAENFKLNEENKQLLRELESAHSELNSCKQNLIDNCSPLNSREDKIKQQSTTDNTINEWKAKFVEVGIRLNQDLIQLIKSKSESQIMNALSVVKESMNKGNVRSKSGLFRRALESDWLPNESDREIQTNANQSTFSEWYERARSYGIVIGSRKENNVIMVQENTGQWHRFEDFSTKWTLDYLKRAQNRTR